MALEPALSTRLTLAHVPLMYFFRRGPFVRPKITTVPVFFVFALNCALVAPSIIIIINPTTVGVHEHPSLRGAHTSRSRNYAGRESSDAGCYLAHVRRLLVRRLQDVARPAQQSSPFLRTQKEAWRGSACART
jgi:hypothetical protein